MPIAQVGAVLDLIYRTSRPVDCHAGVVEMPNVVAGEFD
jgi:hypothetical protein